MLDLFEQYATDESLENNGTWMDHMDGAELLIARLGNRKYVRKLSKAVEKNQKTLDRKDDTADALSDKIMVEVLAETILLDWKGIGTAGKEFPYSKENAIKALGMKDFRAAVMKMANDENEYKAKKEVEQGKP